MQQRAFSHKIEEGGWHGSCNCSHRAGQAPGGFVKQIFSRLSLATLAIAIGMISCRAPLHAQTTQTPDQQTPQTSPDTTTPQSTPNAQPETQQPPSPEMPPQSQQAPSAQTPDQTPDTTAPSSGSKSATPSDSPAA